MTSTFLGGELGMKRSAAVMTPRGFALTWNEQQSQVPPFSLLNIIAPLLRFSPTLDRAKIETCYVNVSNFAHTAKSFSSALPAKC